MSYYKKLLINKIILKIKKNIYIYHWELLPCEPTTIEHNESGVFSVNWSCLSLNTLRTFDNWPSKSSCVFITNNNPCKRCWGTFSSVILSDWTSVNFFFKNWVPINKK